MEMSDFAKINAAEKAAFEFVQKMDDWIRYGYQVVGYKWSDDGDLTLVGESGNGNVASPGYSTWDFPVPREVYWHLLEVPGAYQATGVVGFLHGGGGWFSCPPRRTREEAQEDANNPQCYSDHFMEVVPIIGPTETYTFEQKPVGIGWWR